MDLVNGYPKKRLCAKLVDSQDIPFPFLRICHLCQHSLLSSPPAHLSEVSGKNIFIKRCKKFYRRPTSLARDWMGLAISQA